MIYAFQSDVVNKETEYYVYGGTQVATGEKVRKRTVAARPELTSQEMRISELAAGGAANQDIAEQLFISLATVFSQHLTPWALSSRWTRGEP